MTTILNGISDIINAKGIEKPVEFKEPSVRKDECGVHSNRNVLIREMKLRLILG
jgi:hypothetical protein